jgi:hypothetical protein
MAFKGGAGYGDLFSYNVAGVRGDGLEVQHFAGTIMRQVFSNLVFGRALNESRDAFGKGKGGTFTIPISYDWGQPATVAPLVSGTAISVGTQTFSSIGMVIKEYGTGVGYEGYADFWTNLELQAEITKTLSNHVSRMINWLDYDLLINSKFSLEVPATGSYSSLLATNRQVVATSYGELGRGGLAMLYDTFKKSLVPPITDRGMYILFGNSASFRNLKMGSVFQNYSLYTDFRAQRMQVLGEFMNFVAVETEELTGKGTLIAVGANAGGFGFGQLPRTFFYPDFGSDANRLSVWKTLFYRGQGPIWRDSGTASIVVRCNSTDYDYGQIDD